MALTPLDKLDPYTTGAPQPLYPGVEYIDALAAVMRRQGISVLEVGNIRITAEPRLLDVPEPKDPFSFREPSDNPLNNPRTYPSRMVPTLKRS